MNNNKIYQFFSIIYADNFQYFILDSRLRILKITWNLLFIVFYFKVIDLFYTSDFEKYVIMISSAKDACAFGSKHLGTLYFIYFLTTN